MKDDYRQSPDSPELLPTLFEVAPPDPRLLQLEVASIDVPVVGYGYVDDSELRKELYDIKQESPWVVNDPSYIRTLYNLYAQHRTRYEQREESYGEAFALAKKLAETGIVNPTRYMEEFGEKVFEAAVAYYYTLVNNPDPDGELVRMKHLYYGPWKLAKDLWEYGLDPAGMKLRKVTELIFAILPHSTGGLRIEFMQDGDIDRLFQIEKMFGTVVTDHYRSIFEAVSLSTGTTAAHQANEYLDIMFMLGCASAEEVETFLRKLQQILTGDDAYVIHFIASDWADRYGLAFATEIAEATNPYKDK